MVTQNQAEKKRISKELVILDFVTSTQTVQIECSAHFGEKKTTPKETNVHKKTS